MGRACAPIRSPPGISGTGHPARVYPEAWQAGKAPVGRPLRQRPGAPAQHRPGVVGHLRGGFFALLIWRTAWTGSPPCLGNPQRGNRRRQGELGAGGGPEEFLRESQSRMGAPLRGAPRRRYAHDQPDPALVEGRHLEDGEVYPNEEGTPQGGSISVMLSNVYLHYVLDLWF